MFTRLAYAGAIVLIGAFLVVVSRVPQVQFVEALLFEAVGTVEHGASIPIVRFDQIGQTIATIGQLRAENARLRAEVDLLSQQAVLVPEIQRENAELRSQLGFQNADPQFRWTNARLI